MIRRLAATALLTATIGGITAALLPTTATAEVICIGGDNQRKPGMTGICVPYPVDGQALQVPLPV